MSESRVRAGVAPIMRPRRLLHGPLVICFFSSVSTDSNQILHGSCVDLGSKMHNTPQDTRRGRLKNGNPSGDYPWCVRACGHRLGEGASCHVGLSESGPQTALWEMAPCRPA